MRHQCVYELLIIQKLGTNIFNNKDNSKLIRRIAYPAIF